MRLNIYLAGQIHSDWRQQFRTKAEAMGLDLQILAPQEDHALSDSIGENIIGKQSSKRWRDEVASQVNNLRSRVHMQKADVVIALFGEQYRQWNVAMDAATAIAQDKPVIIIRNPELHHALKELSERAQLVVDTPEQALEALAYIVK